MPTALCRICPRNHAGLSPHRKAWAGTCEPGPVHLRNRVGPAIFDADLEEVYRSGSWPVDVQDALQNICIFETVSDDAETGLCRRVLHMGNLPIGALMMRGETQGRIASAIASVVAITFDRYHSFAN